MNPKNPFVPLVVAAAAGCLIAAALLLGPSHRIGPGIRRSLMSKVTKFEYDPDKVIQYQPKTELPRSFLDKSMEVNPYPLRDLPGFTEKNSFVLPWLEENFSDHESCMDFECNPDAAACDNAKQTEYNNPDGAPPCCTHILRDMLHVFDDGMMNLGLNYFVAYGTMLGLVRSGRVVPWTIDNDVILEDVGALRAVAELWNKELTGLMLVFPGTSRDARPRRVPRMCATRDFAGGRLARWEVPTPTDPEADGLPALFHDRGFPYIDFYYGMETEHGTWGAESRRCRHFRTDVFPVRRFAVYGGQFALNFPASPVALLNRWYGEDWMTPVNTENGHGTPQLTCEVNYGLEDPPADLVQRRLREERVESPEDLAKRRLKEQRTRERTLARRRAREEAVREERKSRTPKE